VIGFVCFVCVLHHYCTRSLFFLYWEKELQGHEWFARVLRYCFLHITCSPRGASLYSDISWCHHSLLVLTSIFFTCVSLFSLGAVCQWTWGSSVNFDGFRQGLLRDNVRIVATWSLQSHFILLNFSSSWMLQGIVSRLQGITWGAWRKHFHFSPPQASFFKKDTQLLCYIVFVVILILFRQWGGYLGKLR